jgi:hypothetical protein
VLSYVWGEAERFKTLRCHLAALQEPGAFLETNAAVTIPQTIRHAMHLVNLLGFASSG